MEKERSGTAIRRYKNAVGGMRMKFVAELSIAKLDDRKAVAAILLENGYVVGPGKRKKSETGKTMDYFLRIYRDENTALEVRTSG